MSTTLYYRPPERHSSPTNDIALKSPIKFIFKRKQFSVKVLHVKLLDIFRYQEILVLTKVFNALSIQLKKSYIFISQTFADYFC
jgi:hypothetical protein